LDAVGITAMLSWASGVYLTGAGDLVPEMACCGLASGNTSCCEGEGDARLVGGTIMTCQRYEATAALLDRSRRRRVIGAQDFYCAPAPC
jgi:hypothetical protein